MGYFALWYSYSVGLFLGIQIGKQPQAIKYVYIQDKDYYNNNQLNYRFNR